MLRISEIQDIVRRNPEPIEVTNIRQQITDSFNKLVFVEEGHHYYLPKDNGEQEELISVSSLISSYEHEVDWEKVAQKYAKKHNMAVETVQRNWKENNLTATSKGSKTHYFGEMAMRLILGDVDLAKQELPFQIQDDYIIPYCPKEEAILQYLCDIVTTPNVWPIMPETKVYTGLNDKYHFRKNYAGTFDILLAMKVQNKICVAIHDYKTNASLTSDFCQNYGVMMNPPFDDMIDEALSHYNIQLNCYQIALSQLDLDIVDRRIIWLLDDGTYQKISLPDVSKRIIDELTAF